MMQKNWRKIMKKGPKHWEACLDQGKNVVFLTLGDPCVYSTFSYLQHRVEADGYHTELVSGITSFCAAARLNVSLSEWNEQLHIVPAVHRLDNDLSESGNYVLMKSGKKMNQVKEILAKSDRDVLMVENCGMPEEHIYRSVEEIPDDAGYYSLIIAKEKKEMIETRNLTKTFDNFTAVDSLNLRLKPENFSVSSVQTAQENNDDQSLSTLLLPTKGRS